STNASNTSYSSTTHAWWRIQQSGSNIQIHTSTNGSSWTQRASWSWNTSWSTCKVEFINTGSGNFIIDGVNTTDLSLPDPVGGTDYEETALTLSASVNFGSPTVTRATFTTGVALPISPTLGALSVVRDSPTTGTALSTSVSLGSPSATQDYPSTGLTVSAETALDDPSTTLHALSSGQNLATEAALLDPEVIFQAESAGQTLSTGVSAEEPATALHASIESPSLDVEADSTTPETSRGAVTDAEALTLTPSVDSPEVSASLSTGVDGLESVVEVSPQVVQDAQDTAESLNVGLSTENPSTQHAASGAANSQSTFVYFSAPSVQVHSKVVVPELSTGASLDPDTSLEAVSEGEELSTGASLDEPATSKRSSSEGLALATTIEAGPGSTETLSDADAPDNTVSMALGTPSVIHRAGSTTESLALGVSNTPTDSLNALSESESLETTPTLTAPESTRRQTAEADSLGLE